MSDEKHEEGADYLARQLLGGRTPDQEFIIEGRRLFVDELILRIFHGLVPDEEERRRIVDRFVLNLQRRADQELAKHRDMSENTSFGRLIRAIAGEPSDLAEATEIRFGGLREHLYKLVE